MSHTGNSVILNGKIDGFIHMPGYPQLSGQEGDETLTDSFTCALSYAGQLPPYGSFFSGDPEFFRQFKYLRLTSRTVTPLVNANIIEITLTYTLPKGDNASGSDASEVTEEWSLATRDSELALEKHPKYKYKWNHKLAQNGSSTPSFWKDAKDELMSAEEAKNFKWLKPGEKAPDGWGIYAVETKPGVEGYRTGVVTVQQTKRHPNKTRLEASAKADYTIQEPAEKFGCNGKWLRGGSSMQKNGRLWELTVEYLCMAEIDEELYGGESTGDKK